MDKRSVPKRIEIPTTKNANPVQVLSGPMSSMICHMVCAHRARVLHIYFLGACVYFSLRLASFPQPLHDAVVGVIHRLTRRLQALVHLVDGLLCEGRMREIVSRRLPLSRQTEIEREKGTRENIYPIVSSRTNFGSACKEGLRE